MRSLFAATLQLVLAVGAGGWAGWSGSAGNLWLAMLAALGLGAAYVASVFATGAAGMVLAPAVLAHAESLRRGGHDPLVVAGRSPRRDYVGSALILAAMGLLMLASLLLSVLIWWLAQGVAAMDVVWRFAVAGLLVCLPMPLLRPVRA